MVEDLRVLDHAGFFLARVYVARPQRASRGQNATIQFGVLPRCLFRNLLPSTGNEPRDGSRPSPSRDYEPSRSAPAGRRSLRQACSTVPEDCFDFAKGNRFSTYATRVILQRAGAERMENQCVAAFTSSPSTRSPSPCATTPTPLSARAQEAQNERRKLLNRWLGRLDKRERRILVNRYGLGVRPRCRLWHRSAGSWRSARNAFARSRSARQAKLHEFASRESAPLAQRLAETRGGRPALV